MRHLPLALFVFGFVLFFSGCKKDPDAVSSALGTSSDATADTATSPSAADVREADLDTLAANFARVHFELDSARLSTEDRALLDENARILAHHPDLVVQLQGHADARGATGYNLALGDQRARSVRDYLGVRGIVADRLPTVTYGEERPLRTGDDESAWSENRRVEFRILAGDRDGVAGTVD